uniref:Uncharacterized protein n=1 Tax=Caenorhabditis japonica TaxID=281687 RepID=A0A2Q4RXP6_CAEJA
MPSKSHKQVARQRQAAAAKNAARAEAERARKVADVQKTVKPLIDFVGQENLGFDERIDRLAGLLDTFDKELAAVKERIARWPEDRKREAAELESLSSPAKKSNGKTEDQGGRK